MNDITMNTLNPTKAITEAIPKLVEVFVSFYGESERERITNKFTNVLIIGYIQPEVINTNLNNLKEKKSEDLIEEFINSFNTDDSYKEKINELYFDNKELEYPNIQPIMRYIKYKEDRIKHNYLKENCVEFLKKIYPNVNINNIDELIDNNFFEELEPIIALYKNKLDEYNKFKASLEQYENYINSCQELKKYIEKKHTKELIEELKDIFTEKEYKEIKEELNKKFYYSIKDVNHKTKNYFGYSLGGIGLIESFSKESEEILKNGSDWKKESIKRDRIEYFKNMGLVLSDNYEDYINHPRAKEIIPSYELVYRIINAKKNYSEKVKEEYYTSLPEYINNRNRINRLGLLDKNDCYDTNLYENNLTAVATNIRYDNEKIVSFPILLFGINNSDEYLDHRLIHELNHLYELDLLEANNKHYKVVSGWDIMDNDLTNNTYFKYEDKRDYELFNEIINEIISQEISTIMNDLNIYIFSNKERKKIKYGTGYEKTRILVQEFYETYKKEILESRKQGNYSIIYDAVGKENFDELNSLINQFEDAFSFGNIYKVYNDFDKNKVTPDTILYNELIEKRNETLTKMHEYHMNKNKI